MEVTLSTVPEILRHWGIFGLHFSVMSDYEEEEKMRQHLAPAFKELRKGLLLAILVSILFFWGFSKVLALPHTG